MTTSGSKRTGKLRDLELLLLGAILTNTDRGASILRSLPAEYFSREVAGLIDALQEKKREPMEKWLSERGAKLEHKKSTLDAAVEAVINHVRHEEAKALIRQLNASASVGNLEDLADDMQSVMARLEELLGVFGNRSGESVGSDSSAG